MTALLSDRQPSALDRAAIAEPVARFFGLESAPAPTSAPEGDGAASAPPSRPVLRVIPGGAEATRRVRRSPEVYRRRRLGLLLVAAAIVTLGWAGAAVATSGPDAATTTPSSRSSASSGADGQVAPLGLAGGGLELASTYVVQPGDTLWDIAERLSPHGDIRPVVDRLADQVGGGPLEAGTRLDLDAARP